MCFTITGSSEYRASHPGADGPQCVAANPEVESGTRDPASAGVDRTGEVLPIASLRSDPGIGRYGLISIVSLRKTHIRMSEQIRCRSGQKQALQAEVDRLQQKDMNLLQENRQVNEKLVEFEKVPVLNESEDFFFNFFWFVIFEVPNFARRFVPCSI